MKTKIEIITPAKAKELLRRNTRNRPPKLRAIDRFAVEMKAGRWGLTHQGIAFDEDGVLIDGQNRLLAIIQAGIPVQMCVTTGVPKMLTSRLEGAEGEHSNDIFTQDIVDTGTIRSTADQMHIMHGVPNASCISSAVRAIVTICSPYAGHHRLSVATAMFVYEQYANELQETVSLVAKFAPGRKTAIIGTFAFCMKADARLLTLIQEFSNGENLKRGDAALTLRNHVLSSHGEMRFKLADTTIIAEWVGNACYNYLNSEAYLTIKRGKHGLEFFKTRQKASVDKIRAFVSEVQQPTPTPA